jgi:hypothetical protein
MTRFQDHIRLHRQPTSRQGNTASMLQSAAHAPEEVAINAIFNREQMNATIALEGSNGVGLRRKKIDFGARNTGTDNGSLNRREVDSRVALPVFNLLNKSVADAGASSRDAIFRWGQKVAKLASGQGKDVSLQRKKMRLRRRRKKTMISSRTRRDGQGSRLRVALPLFDL